MTTNSLMILGAMLAFSTTSVRRPRPRPPRLRGR